MLYNKLIINLLPLVLIMPLYSLLGLDNTSILGYLLTIYLFWMAPFYLVTNYIFNDLIKGYNNQGFNYFKEKTYLLVLILTLIISLIMASVLVFNPNFISNILPQNSNSHLILSLKLLSLLIIIKPLMIVIGGYLRAHDLNKYLKITNYYEKLLMLIVTIFSLIIISLFKIDSFIFIIILICSYVFINLFFGLYYLKIMLKYKLYQNSLKTRDEAKISLKKGLISKIPLTFNFIILGITLFAYNLIDSLIIYPNLINKYQFDVSKGILVLNVINIMGFIFVFLIIISVYKYLKKTFKNKFSLKDLPHIYTKIALIFIPLISIISILGRPLWILFYGSSNLNNFFSIYLIQTILLIFYLISIMYIYKIKEYKIGLISLIVGLVLKISFTVSLMPSINKIGTPPYYASVLANIISYLMVIIIINVFFIKKYKIDFNSFMRKIINIIYAVIVMATFLILSQFIFPFTNLSRLTSLIYIIIYLIIGTIIYLFLTRKISGLDEITKNSSFN